MKAITPALLYKPRQLALAIGACLLAAPAAQAIGLGAASTVSRIGEPLRVEIPIQLAASEQASLDCIRLAPSPRDHTDELPRLGSARLSLEQGGRLLVISAPPVRHPAIALGVSLSCGTALRREYTLLLDPPLTLPEAPTPEARPLTSGSAADAPPGWQTAPGESALSIARTLLPNDQASQQRLARAIVLANPAIYPSAAADDSRTVVPAGTRLIIPALPAASLPAQAQQVRPPRSGNSTAQTDAPRTKPRNKAKPSAPPVARDRLFIEAPGDFSLRMSTTLGDAGVAALAGRGKPGNERLMLAELDEKIATQIELADRLRQLEAIQARLREESQRLAAELQARGIDAATTPDPAPLAISKVPVTAPRLSDPAPAPWQGWQILGLSMLGFVLAVFTLRWGLLRRQRLHQDANATALSEGAEVPEHLIDPISEADVWPDEAGQAPRSVPRMASVMEGAFSTLSVSGLGSASILQIVENDIEEHDSAIELADIMLSFGRVQGAAQTLSDFIRSNPNQAVKPWIKLMEVYRVAGMKVEFDALSHQLNKTFNVRPAPWDDFELARKNPDSLEDMPHIMQRLDATWETRACQALLHDLLRDNRQGTRQGFPLAIIDEILLLLGMLEAKLGPYRPAQDAPEGLAPATAAALQTIATINAASNSASNALQASSTNTIQSSGKELMQTMAATTDLNQLDFDLDMTELNKTLHINLDELDENGRVRR